MFPGGQVEFLHQDLLGAEFLASVDQGDLAGEAPGQVEGVLDGGVSPADGQHVLVAVEGPVAGGAIANPRGLAHGLLTGDAQVAVVATGGQNDRAGRMRRLPVVDADLDDPVVAADQTVGGLPGGDGGAEFYRLGGHLGDQVRAGNTFVTGVVLNPLGEHDLPARQAVFLQDQRLVAVAGGVQRRSQPGRSAADDDHVVNIDFAHGVAFLAMAEASGNRSMTPVAAADPMTQPAGGRSENPSPRSK